jgi:hypothetical protein
MAGAPAQGIDSALFHLLVIVRTKAAAAFFKDLVQMVLACIHSPGQDKIYCGLGALQGGSAGAFAEVLACL